MEILLLLLIGFAAKTAFDHARQSSAASRGQRQKEIAGKYPKGVSKAKRAALLRRHDAGYWAREGLNGFPAARHGWAVGWVSHKAAVEQAKSARAVAEAEHADAQLNRHKVTAEHRRMRDEARRQIEEELAAEQAKGSPATGRKAVRGAADEVARKRAQKVQPSAGKCPACGAPDGYPHLDGCDPSAPPLPADSVRRAEPVVIDTPARVHNAEDSDWLRPGESRCEGCGGSGRNDAGDDACPACRGWGGAPADPDGPQAPPGTICRACGRPGTREDPVVQALGGEIHRSHALARQEAYAGALRRLYPDDGEIDDAVIGADHGFEGEYELDRLQPSADAATWTPDAVASLVEGRPCWIDYQCRDIGYGVEEGSGEFVYRGSASAGKHEFAPVDGGPSIYLFPDEIQEVLHDHHAQPSPTTQGAPVTADTNYTTVLTNAKGFADQADGDAATARTRRAVAERHLEEMQAAEVDAATLSSQMDLVEKLRAAEEAHQGIGEHATEVSDGLQRRHGGLHAAHQEAPIARAAVREFYEGD